MKANLPNSDRLSLGLILGTSALTASVYARLPSRIATHFDLHGVANGWMSRPVGAWLVPAVALGSWVLLRLGGTFLPEGTRARFAASPVGAAAAVLVALMSTMQCIILYSALLQPASVGTPLALVLGGSWVALGLLLPRIRRNPWVGVRTPWTLSSDDNWQKTHRFAGFTFFFGGIVAVILTVVGAAALGVAVMIAAALSTILYSFVLARRLPPHR
jgi:uncharacterized membrane protein